MELDFMVNGWNEFYETHSLKRDYEDEIWKKLMDLEKLRTELADDNICVELSTIKKKVK